MGAYAHLPRTGHTDVEVRPQKQLLASIHLVRIHGLYRRCVPLYRLQDQRDREDIFGGRLWFRVSLHHLAKVVLVLPLPQAGQLSLVAL